MIQLLLGLVYLLAHAPDQCEATDRFRATVGWEISGDHPLTRTGERASCRGCS